MTRLIKPKLAPPHGGHLKSLLVKEGSDLEEERQTANSLRQVTLTSKEVSDLIMLANGAFSPLEGFMCREDYTTVLDEMKLTDGTLWPVPVTLALEGTQAQEVELGEQIALMEEGRNEPLGTMEVRDKFKYDKQWEAQADVYLGGTVKAFSEGDYPHEFPEYARPQETRQLFEELGWSMVTAFQTRNPLHRSHEYLTKIALEVSDGVLIHPIVGALKPGDIPTAARMKCYRTLLQHYFLQERVVLKVCSMEMRYAGPKEAVLHAIIRQNYGCSHIIIGRDHAGVGSYYRPFDAQAIFEQLPEGALTIKPVKLDWTFWCYACGGMASMRTFPHDKDKRLLISGTELRNMLSTGTKPPEEFSRPEVLDILLEYYRQGKEK